MTEPLAHRFRPQTLDEIVGQEHILGEGMLLRRLIETDRLSCMILYGPPGTGKTTIANVIANTTNLDFEKVNAVSAGVADLRKITTNCKNLDKRCVLFIDEIHRFNKSQQDFLLPFVEDGTIILIGATTENPYFEVNKALLSRATIFELKPLSKENIQKLMLQAIYTTRGLNIPNICPDIEAIKFLADVADGDARKALNAIELAATTTPPSEDGNIYITMPVAENCIQTRSLNYDKDGDNHYDLVSAFIKSIRGSDPHAAVYWMARILKAGGNTEARFICRRMMVHAAEDIGIADPRALQIATSAAYALDHIGLPEARIPMTEAAIYLARAPKSNACINAIDTAYQIVDATGNLPVPPHLQDAHYSGAADLNRGTGYLYPHDYPNHWVEQQYMPDALVGTQIYDYDKDLPF